MQTFKTKRDANASTSAGNSKRARISIYDEPPTGVVGLEEFEQFALDRMRVLKVRLCNDVYSFIILIDGRFGPTRRQSMQQKQKE
jgi:hypothetical protein